MEKDEKRLAAIFASPEARVPFDNYTWFPLPSDSSSLSSSTGSGVDRHLIDLPSFDDAKARKKIK